jgi:hypothetical protein
VLRFCHARQRVLGRPLAGLEALRLPETLGIAGHGRIAPLVALLLEAMKDVQGVMAPPIPELEDQVFVGVQNTVPAPFIGALRTGGAPQGAKDRARGQVQLVRNGLPRPALPASRPNLLVACEPAAPAVGSLELRVASRSARGHRHHHGPIRLPVWGLRHGRMDDLERGARAIEEWGERFRQVLYQMEAIRQLDGLRGPVPGPVGRGFRPIPRAHLHAGVGLEPLRERVTLAVREQGDGLAVVHSM